MINSFGPKNIHCPDQESSNLSAKKDNFLFSIKKHCFSKNKTDLQPVTRPVEQILGFFQRLLKMDYFQRVLKWCKKYAL